jgi:hypothetical protein
MKPINKISFFLALILGCTTAMISESSCNVYKFKDVSIPVEIKTVKVNYIENKARYVNPVLSPALTDKLRQKIIGQTRLVQTNGDNPDWEISGQITDYVLTTSAISGQKEAGNRLTITVHITKTDHKSDEVSEYDITRPFEFGASLSLQQAEQSMATEILRTLTDDIFNKLFSSW